MILFCAAVATMLSARLAGGIVTQVKQPSTAQHRSLTECLAAPGNFLLSDFSKIERSQLLHTAFQTLEAYAVKTGKLPAPGCKADMEAFGAAFKEFNAAQVCAMLLSCCAAHISSHCIAPG